MEWIVGYTKEESKNLESVLNFRVTDSEKLEPAEWEVVLFYEQHPKYIFEGAKYSNYGVLFTKVIDGAVSDNKYWQFSYGADTLLGTDDHSDIHDRNVGICLHGGGMYEESIGMGAEAYHEALDKIEKKLTS